MRKIITVFIASKAEDIMFFGYIRASITRNYSKISTVNEKMKKKLFWWYPTLLGGLLRFTN